MEYEVLKVGGWREFNTLFMIATMQYLGHLMTLEERGRQNALLKIAMKQYLGQLVEGGSGGFKNALFNIAIKQCLGCLSFDALN